MKRFLIPIIIACFSLSTFTGCSNGKGKDSVNQAATTQKEQTNFNETGYPITKEKVTMKMMGPKAAIQTTWDKMDVFLKLEELTNIHFEFDTPPSENYQEKKSLAFASGELPDVFFGRGSISSEDESLYGTQGLLKPMESLIDKHAPNIKKLFEATPNIKKAVTSLDGHIYSLPSGTDLAMNLTGKIWINQDWLNNVGMKMPSTTDELYNALVAFRDKDPNKNGKADEIPLSFEKAQITGIRTGMLCAFGYASNRFDSKDGKAVFVPVQSGYKSYLTYMNKLYTEKLIDNESFSQSAQQLTAKGNEGRVGVFSHAGPFLVVKVEDNNKYPALPPLTSPSNSQKMWYKYSEVSGTAFSITNKNKFPEATIRWADYIFTEEGCVLMHNGVEGKHWKWSDSSKTMWERTTPEGQSPEQWRGTATPNAGTGTPEIWPKSYAEKQNDPLNAFIRKEVKDKYESYWREPFPNVRFSPEEQKRISTINSDLNTYIDQMESKFIIGQESLDKWDNYVSTVNKMGLEELVKIYQSAYDRWKNIK